MPVLIRLMEITKGDILELGTGLYSTPFLHYACFLQNRKIVSYENIWKYYRLVRQYNTEFHQIIFVKDWDKIGIKRPWDIAFVDQEPPIVRKDSAKKLAHYAKFVVLHDSELKVKNYYHYEEIYPLYKYHYNFDKILPNTIILSNFKDLNDKNFRLHFEKVRIRS